MKKITLFTSLIILASLSWSVSAITISGSDLAALTYHNPPDAQYVPAAGLAPALAALSTPDSGTSASADAPTVFVRAANVGQPSLGTLDSLNASYHLYSSSGGNGNQAYWLTYLFAPGGGYIGVVTFGGPNLNGSSQIHVFYDFDSDPNPHTTSDYWGDTLSTLDGTQYNGTTTFGLLGVYETGIEIGDWDNGAATIPATADIDSITIGAPTLAPDVASTLFLLSLGFASLVFFGYRKNRPAIAK